MAVSVNLLDFYSALFERSCDAVNALASALSSYYTRRGFIMLNAKVCSQPVVLLLLFKLYRASPSQTHSAEGLAMPSSGTITYASGLMNKWSKRHSVQVSLSYIQMYRVHQNHQNHLNVGAFFKVVALLVFLEMYLVGHLISGLDYCSR